MSRDLPNDEPLNIEIVHIFRQPNPPEIMLAPQLEDISADISFSGLEFNRVNIHELNYDHNLTSAHKYLGDELHETNGRKIFEEDLTHQIPVIFLTSNLIPKQIFPMIATSDTLRRLLTYAITRNYVFGVSYKLGENMVTYGTIAEIYAHSGNIETSDKIYVKAMGHQRYKILKTEPFPESNDENIVLAHIRIIPDVTLSNPFSKLNLRNRHTSNSYNLNRTKGMWQTQWPDWVYKQFDVNELASRVTDKVNMLYGNVKLTEDPYLLSLQVTKLGIFKKEQVYQLLSLESTNLRLQQELSYLDENQKASLCSLSNQKFMCNSEGCRACICDLHQIFSMSPDGPQGTYCNPWGQIHDMITVYRLEPGLGPIRVGLPSDECCWFPGYKWTIILCPRCENHLGWRYTADGDSTLKPRLFYGLSMSSITSDKEYTPNEDDALLRQYNLMPY